METAICTNPNCFCKNQEQEINNFSRNKNRINGRSAWCKSCRKEYNKKNKEQWQQYNKNYKKNNKEYIEKYENEVYKEKRKELCVKWKHQKSYYDTFFQKISIYEETRRDPNNDKLIQIKCNFCKEWFNPTNSQIQNRLSCIEKDYKQGEARLYCSDVCKLKCPVYKQIKRTKDQKIKTSYRQMQSELRSMVLERDQYTCQICGEKKSNLICHHFTGVEQNPLESADVDNCITLCVECDNYVHNLSGCRRIDLICNKK